MHMNPEVKADLDLHEGDYVHVDANPADRPYRGWKPDDWFYKVSRLMVRVKFNPAYPYDVVMTATRPSSRPRSRCSHTSRGPTVERSPEDTGYQASFRYGSHQSLTRDWSMPMHQTDSLFHKSKDAQHFVFGYEADNHAVNNAEGDARPGRVRRGRRTARTRRLEAGHDQGSPGLGEPRDGGLPARPLRPAGGPMSPLRDPDAST